MRSCGAAQRRTETTLLVASILQPPWLIAAIWLEASGAVEAGLALDPTFTIALFRAGAYSDNPVYLAGRERLIEGMRQAGVPEG